MYVCCGYNNKRAIVRARDSGSSWLSVLPIECHHFDLSSPQFRDALALRYWKLFAIYVVLRLV